MIMEFTHQVHLEYECSAHQLNKTWLINLLVMRRSLNTEFSMSSMADIAFLLLIFFLVATTMEVDQGIIRKLPPMLVSDPVTFHERDILEVLINRDNKLMVEGEETDIAELRALAKEFIANPANESHLPEKVSLHIDHFGDVKVTKKHVISLRSDRGTSYDMYIAVQNELVGAYNELREELAQSRWNLPFLSLYEERKAAIAVIYPMKISEAEPNN